MNLDALTPFGWSLFGVVACVLFALGAWYFRPGGQPRLLPPQRCRAVPWSGWEVLAAIFFEQIFWAGLMLQVLTDLGFFTWLYGPEFVKALTDLAPAAKHSHRFALERAGIWLSVICFPPIAASIVLLFRILSGTRPYQLGLTWHRWGRNVLAGALAWVVFTPFIYLVLKLATSISVWALHLEPEEHPLARLATQSLRPVEWVVLVVSAVVAAPVLEELLFRGVLQRWLARRPWGGMGAVTAAVLLALAFTIPEVRHARDLHGWTGVLGILAPVLFALIMAPGVLVLQRRSETAAAIYGTALLFGTAHAAVWPTPVPLFVLGLGLGLLAYRTQSLVAPITLHALFNGVACVMLIWPQLVPHPDPGKGNDVTSAPRRVSPASTSTAVPASWCPRRRYASAIGPSRGDTTDEVTCPTASPPRSTRAPAGAIPSPCSFSPTSVRLTWPRSRAMTIGSWPR